MLHKNAIKYVKQEYTLIFIYYVIRFGIIRFGSVRLEYLSFGIRYFGILPASVHHWVRNELVSDYQF